MRRRSRTRVGIETRDAGRTSASASASGARVGQLERELEDERAVVIRLKRELREANGNAERLRESHEEAKKFALASEKTRGGVDRTNAALGVRAR